MRLRAAIAIALALVPAATATAATKPGDPAKKGIVALRCTIEIADQSFATQFLEAIARHLWKSLPSNGTEISSRPYLVPVGDPGKKILARKQGDVYIAADLAPGAYRILVMGSTPASRLPGGGKADDIVTMWYDPSRAGPSEVSPVVQPGAIIYLGNLTVVDMTYPESGIHMGEDGVRFVLRRTPEEGRSALDEIRTWIGKSHEAASWRPILDAHATAELDTTLVW